MKIMLYESINISEWRKLELESTRSSEWRIIIVDKHYRSWMKL